MVNCLMRWWVPCVVLIKCIDCHRKQLKNTFQVVKLLWLISKQKKYNGFKMALIFVLLLPLRSKIYKSLIFTILQTLVCVAIDHNSQWGEQNELEVIKINMTKFNIISIFFQRQTNLGKFKNKKMWYAWLPLKQIYTRSQNDIEVKIYRSMYGI